MARTTYVYRGVVIFRRTEPGYALRYTARTEDGTPLAADTLGCIKELIRYATVGRKIVGA
jgi:hypothetical protein